MNNINGIDVSNLSGEQKLEVMLGFMHGLNKEQVELYSNPEFDERQMSQIRYGLECKIDINKIKAYSNPNYDSKKMGFMRNGFMRDLTVAELELVNPMKYMLDLNTVCQYRR